jgi:hypothetical protein
MERARATIDYLFDGRPDREASAGSSRWAGSADDMVDKISLATIGLVFGGVTFAVVLVAAIAVQAQVDGQLSQDRAREQIATAAGLTQTR